MIKNLIFDFGKVLVDYDFELFFRRFILDEEKRRHISSFLDNPELTEEMDRETVPTDDIINRLKKQHDDLAPEIQIFYDHYPEIVTGEVPGMYGMLSRLKAEGYRLYGLTNWCSKVRITMKQYGIFRQLDGAVISSDIHIIKPEPGIYQHLFDNYGLKPEECIFTDDKPENIAGGNALGMQGIVFHDAKQYENELRHLLNIYAS